MQVLRDFFPANPTRGTALADWLRAQADLHGLVVDSFSAASADASFRRYFRIATRDGNSRIVMDAPPEHENCEPFVRIAGLLRSAGCRAPDVLAWDEAQGFMLLSDVGARTVLQHLGPPGSEPDPSLALPFQRAAIDQLLLWQRASQPHVLPPYDGAVMRREVDLFADWYVGQHLQRPMGESERADWQAATQTVLDECLQHPRVYVHRDFMLRNLMVQPQGGVALLDFQDALHGPVTYDIASLMRDAFVSWPDEAVLDVTVRYWQAAKAQGVLGEAHGERSAAFAEDFGLFWRAVDFMALQRHLKVMGIFARLTLRDGKPQYLADTPRFWAYVRPVLSRYRELAPLARLMHRYDPQPPAVAYSLR
jgi:aminoglycoside/choline kinase family phosphotransferase